MMYSGLLDAHLLYFIFLSLCNTSKAAHSRRLKLSILQIMNSAGPDFNKIVTDPITDHKIPFSQKQVRNVNTHVWFGSWCTRLKCSGSLIGFFLHTHSLKWSQFFQLKVFVSICLLFLFFGP